MGRCGAVRRRLLGALSAVAAGAALLSWPGAASAATSPPAPPAPTTTTTLPPLPAVDPSITDGQPATSLLANAIALSSVGADSAAIGSALAVTQSKLDADATAAVQAQAAAGGAEQRAAYARQRAATAEKAYTSMAGAVRNAVVFLYMSGPDALAVSPTAGAAALYAQDYADAAVSPYGVLAKHRRLAGEREAALRSAESASKAADAERAKAAKDLADQEAQAANLRAELAAVAGASSAQVAADHLSLAGEAAKNLVSAGALQFTPPSPLPPQVATTSVALTWAFAELGKPYVWGATGPDSFDCSGLTQFVWRAAGVAIPRVAADQDAWAIPVPLSELLPGDLVFFGTTDIHHVGIYIGDGLMINAPHTGDVVRVSSIWWSDLAGFGRVHAPGTPVPPHATPTASKPAAPVVVPAAGPVPSQPAPPPGWAPTPGSSTPIAIPGSADAMPPTTLPAEATTTTSTTSTLPAPTTTTTVVGAPTTTTTVAPEPTSTSTSTPGS